MIKKLKKLFHQDERGITGLETAIILIAFVVVAAVFGYTVLSAGLFSTQKSQEAVYSGLQEAQSTVEIKGAVIAKSDATRVTQLTFTVANALGGEPINFAAPTMSAGVDGTAKSGTAGTNYVTISYTDQDQKIDNLYWTVTKLGDADSDDLLENGEKFQITIGAAGGLGDLQDALNPDLGANKSFTLEMKSPQGAVLSFERTTPAALDAVMNLN